MHSPSVVDLQSVCRLLTVCAEFAVVERGGIEENINLFPPLLLASPSPRAVRPLTHRALPQTRPRKGATA